MIDKRTILVTGAAGFIGAALSSRLLSQGHEIIGLDNLNSYYSVRLKRARLEQLTSQTNFRFVECDISDEHSMAAHFQNMHKVDGVVHLAAQAGVRYSLEAPLEYVSSNLTGQVVVLENIRKLPSLRNFVYASSSSVYGSSDLEFFSPRQPTDRPSSLYAATKKSGELITRSYCHLYRIPAVGLRFFTVYGPWGRPDMAPCLFADAITSGKPIKVFNHGKMERDFTYIDDIVDGIVASLSHQPRLDEDGAPHQVFNLGNNRPTKLLEFIRTLENALGIEAKLEFLDMQPGDVRRTAADIDDSIEELRFQPRVTIEDGLTKFAEWFLLEKPRLWA